MKTISVSLVAGMLLLAASAASEAGWRKASVTLGWVRQPNPDETGKSSAQQTKLLGTDTLNYSRVDQVEKYVLTIGDERGGRTVVSVLLPKGVAVDFTGAHCEPNGVCEAYEVDRTGGKRASVEFSTNAPQPSSMPNTIFN